MCPLRICRVILTTDFAACLDTRRQLLLISTCSQVKGKENHNTKNLNEVINQHCSRPPLKRKNPYLVKKYMFKYYRCQCRFHEARLMVCLEGRMKKQEHAFSLLFSERKSTFQHFGQCWVQHSCCVQVFSPQKFSHVHICLQSITGKVAFRSEILCQCP